MLLNQVTQHRIRLDHNEDKAVRHAGRHPAHNASDLHRIKLANHHPRHHQKAECARDDEDKYAGDWEPRVHRRNSLRIPNRLVVHVSAKSDHRHTAADAGNEAERSSAAPSHRNASHNGENESQGTEDDCEIVCVHLSAAFFEDFDLKGKLI